MIILDEANKQLKIKHNVVNKKKQKLKQKCRYRRHLHSTNKQAWGSPWKPKTERLHLPPGTLRTLHSPQNP